MAPQKAGGLLAWFSSPDSSDSSKPSSFRPGMTLDGCLRYSLLVFIVLVFVCVFEGLTSDQS